MRLKRWILLVALVACLLAAGVQYCRAGRAVYVRTPEGDTSVYWVFIGRVHLQYMTSPRWGYVSVALRKR